MVNYKLIIRYHIEGRNNSTISKLYECSRHTIINFLKIINDKHLDIDDLINKENKALYVLYFLLNIQVNRGI